jgi:hypothetical protein
MSDQDEFSQRTPEEVRRALVQTDRGIEAVQDFLANWPPPEWARRRAALGQVRAIVRDHPHLRPRFLELGWSGHALPGPPCDNAATEGTEGT